MTDPLHLRIEEVLRWLHEESATLHPEDDFEGPRLTLITAIAEAAIRYLRSGEADGREFKAVGYVDLGGVAHWESGRLPEGVEAMLYILEKR